MGTSSIGGCTPRCARFAKGLETGNIYHGQGCFLANRLAFPPEKIYWHKLNSLLGEKAMPRIEPWLAFGVLLSTAATDAVYVLFNAAVSSHRRLPAATWSSVWYLLSAFAVISYTKNWAYVAFAATGSWIGAYISMTLLRKPKTMGGR